MTVTYPNGAIPKALLKPVPNFRPLTSRVNENMGSNLLRLDAQAALVLLQVAFLQAHGRPLYVSEAYRGLTLQTAYWQDFQAGVGNLAAYPGTSNHGKAVSVDFGSGVGTYGSVAKVWMDEHAPDYGWHPTGNGFSRPEGWHFDYIPGTATITPASGGTATPIEEEDTMDARQEKSLNDRLDNIEKMLTTIRTDTTDTPAKVWSHKVNGTDTAAVLLDAASKAKGFLEKVGEKVWSFSPNGSKTAAFLIDQAAKKDSSK